jgi:hypothetical protein
MQKYGFRHTSADTIEYKNGYTAEGLDKKPDGTFGRISVIKGIGEMNAGRMRVEYKPGDEHFAEIQDHIRGKAKPLTQPG